MPKKILYIGNILSKHGFTPTNIETLGPRLEEEGFQVLYASDKKNPVSRLFAMLASILKHKKTLDVVLIDTYSTNAFYFAWASSQLCRLLQINYVPILHGGNLPQRIKQCPKLAKQIFANSYSNVVVSAYLQKCLEQYNFKNLLIPNNVNAHAYYFLHRAMVTPKLLWVRAFDKIYNPQLAVLLVACLSKKYPDVALTMIGPDKDGSLELCKKLSVELNVEDKITFTGRLSKEEWIIASKKHDIFINTTNFDNLPVSLLEAMLLGLPVVSTNVGGISYLIQDRIDGLLVNKDDVISMSAAVEALLTETNLASSISLNARKNAENYDWEIVKTKWLSLLGNTGY